MVFKYTTEEVIPVSFKDGNLPPKNSSEGKKLEKMVYNTPFLKKMRAKSQGEKYSDIVSADKSEEYKQNYDKIDWTHNRDQKKNYRVKINGKYQDED